MAQCSVPCLACARGGDRVQVVAVDGEDALARRLSDLGLWPGTVVEVVTRAPFGDPILFRLRGYRLALRREEARRVRTGPAEPAA